MNEPNRLKPLVILFSKAPIPGRVKTRMMSRFSAEEAAEIHQAMTGDAMEMLQGLEAAAALELHTDQPTEAWNEFGWTQRIQPAGDLGQKLLLTIEQALRSGRAAVLILGSDSPGLPAENVLKLLDSDADVTLGPSEDGGFYGICVRRASPEMFRGVRWSTSQTLADTIAAIQAAGLSAATGERWFDIDEAEDLEKLRGSGTAIGARLGKLLFAPPKPAEREQD